jgi:hypothetical protein
MPTVDRQGQGTPHPNIVERLFLVVRDDEGAAIPVALLDRQLVAERGFQLVARGRREAAELGGGATGAQRIEPGRLLVGVDPDKAVEVGQAGLMVIGVADTFDRCPISYASSLKGPEPRTFFSYQCGSLSRTAFR